MNNRLREIFYTENIEFFGVAPYSECKVISERIESTIPFLPKSAVIYLVPYYLGDGENLSAYAVSCDYHVYMRECSERIISGLRDIYPEGSFAAFSDHSPIDERHTAASLGLGIIGDNRLLINKKYGSYVFIGEIITSLEADLLGASAIGAIKTCEHCGICKNACPTGSLIGDGECLSEITQKKGELSAENIALMRRINTVWGCDVCQRVCPHNNGISPSPIEFFAKDRITRLTSEILSNMTDEEFSQRAYSWRKRKTVERNLKELEY